jgi:O-methyltransferase
VALKLWRVLVAALSLPIILLDYFRSDTGREYGVGFFTKIRLIYRMARNRSRITTASHWVEHLIMATQILRVPRQIEGCVVECGSFRGGSAANLSLVCALCDRKLELFDSFQGLPEPSDADKSHVLVGQREIHTYGKGAFRGTLDEVKNNIAKCGDISRCDFHPGYFDQTLPDFHEKCVLAFIDVDLTDSLKTCLTFIWPLLQSGCYLFTHEAHHMEIAHLFFDDPWWHATLHCDSPGLIGAGTGLGLIPASGGYTSALGYAVRTPALAEFKINPQVGVAR